MYPIKCLIALALFAFVTSSYAMSRRSEIAYDVGTQLCAISAKTHSDYALWVSEFRTSLEKTTSERPELAKEARELFQRLNEQYKDTLYTQTRKIHDGLSRRDLAEYAKLVNDLVMSRAEFIGNKDRNMSKTYYQRTLESWCTEQVLNMKLD